MARLEKFRHGQHLTRERLNKMVAAIQRNSDLRVGPGLHLRDTASGRTLDLATPRRNQKTQRATVVVATKPESDLRPIEVQTVAYLDAAPDFLVPGAYVLVGDPFEAYPEVGAMPLEFVGLETFEDPPTIQGSTFLDARFESGRWFVRLPSVGQTRHVVVRAVIPGANYVTVEDVQPVLDENGLLTSELKIVPGPWDAFVHPKSSAEDYQAFIWPVELEIEEATAVIFADKLHGVWWLRQYFRFEVPTLARSTIFHDCTPHLKELNL